MADISNSVSNTIITGTADNDSISNSGSKVTIDGGKGNDTVDNDAANVSIGGGADNDSISNSYNGSGVTIAASAGNDSITNSGKNVSISGGAGNDSIYNNSYGDSVTIDAGEGADTVNNYGDSSRINLGKGNDYIYSNGSGVTVDAGAGNDSIYNSSYYGGGNNVSINSGTGNDSIENWYCKNVSIDAGEGADTVNNYGDSLRINLGKGNDYVKNSGDSVTIDAGAGNDLIQNGGYWYEDEDDYWTEHDGGSNLSINGGTGNDSITNYQGDSVIIDGGAGNDSIANKSWYSTINAGDGDDHVENNYGSDNTSINGGAGNDSIYNGGDKVTINAGTGNDSIWNSGSNVLFKYTSGNDIIEGFRADSTLQIMSGNIKSNSADGTDVVLTIGANKVTLKGVGNIDNINIIDTLGNAETFNITSLKSIKGTAKSDSIRNAVAGTTIKVLGGNDTVDNSGDSVIINGEAGQDYIYNNGDNVTIDAGDGADTVSNYGGSSRINLGNGNDSIYNYSGYVTIDSGTGQDYIFNNGSNVSIDGGDGADTVSNSGSFSRVNLGNGNDSVSNYGSHVTINAGKGNDTIYSNGDNVLFRYTSGNDFIEGLDSSSTLQIVSGSIKSGSLNGTDAILTIGTNTVTVKGIGSTTNYINVINSSGDAERFIIPKTIKGTSISESIDNEAFGTKINALGGNDTISNTGSGVKINGGEGNDSVVNYASDVTIDGDTGDDYIYSNGYNVSINAGAGKDTIRNYGSNVTIDAGTGNDDIYNNGSNVLFKYTSGNDIIEGFDSSSTLQIMSGSIKSGLWSGNDAILTIGKSTVTLKGLADNTNRINVINANGKAETFVIPATITGTADSDSINNAESSDAIIDALAGNDKVNNSGENVSVSGGAGRDYISNTGKNSTISGGAGNDTISNDAGGSNVTISGGDGNDSITNSLNSYVSIDGGKGNDNITNTKGDNVTILGGTGSDAIKNSGGNNLLIDAGADNDNIINVISSNRNKSLNSSVFGGAGDDVISNNADDVTLGGGKGNDVINNNYYYEDDEEEFGGSVTSGNNVTFQYSGGNDIIFGFNKTSILEIGDGNATYSTAKNGNDVIVTVGKGKITLAGAAALSNLNIVGEEVELVPTWRINGMTASYGTKSKTLVTIIGIKSLEGIEINDTAKTVTVPMSALTKSNVAISGDGYKLALADDVTAPITTAAHFNDTIYKSESNTAGYTLVDNKIIYTAAKKEKDLFTISGVKSVKGIKVDKKTVTVPKSVLGIGEVTVSKGYKLALAKGVELSTSIPAHFDGTTYKSVSRTEGYILEDNKITYAEATEATDLFTISGVKSTSGIKVNELMVTVPASSLTESNVTVNNGYMLELASDVKRSTSEEAHFIGATYKSTSNTAGYTLSDNKIIYMPEKKATDLFTISGVKSTADITVSNKKVVTVPLSSLTESNVSINGNYTLKLGFDVTKPESEKVWTFDKETKAATYSQTTTAGYKLASNAKSITYLEETVKNLVKVDGVKSSNGLSVNTKDKKVTVSASALGTSNVTVSTGYTLALDIDVPKSKNAKATWTHSGTKAAYKSSATTAGYSLSQNAKSITYSAAKDSSTLATVDGIKANAAPTVKDDVITLTKANLSSNKVTVNSNAYEFNFAKDDYKGTSVTGSKNVDNITSSGSNLSIAGGAGNDLIKALGSATTVTGGEGDDSLVSNGKGGNVFVYASGDGNDVITNFGKSDKIKITKGTAKVALNGSDVIFTVGKGSITVKDAADVTYIDSKGKEHTPDVSLSGSAVKLLENYSEDTFNAADYGDNLRTINAAEVVHDISITGNKLTNTITGSAQDDYIDGGAGKDVLRGGAGNDTLIGGAGNDTLSGGDGSDVFVYAKGDGNDVIYNYSAKDEIKITSGTAKIEKRGKDVIFTVGKGKITVKDAADKVVTYIDAKGKTNYYPAPTKDSIIINGTAVTILEEYKSATFDVGNVKNGNKVKMIDASSTSHNLKIIGNAQNNLILGGYGDDTIYGGKGNDTLQGSEGKNVFVYQSGNDVIIDYNTGDKINLESGAISSASVKGSDTVLKVGKGKITLTNGADKVITTVDKDGNNRIIGNDAANEIHGGTGNDTLQGGKGNDSLWGDAGNDTFIYNKGDGKDTIMDYQSGDLLQIVDGSFSKSAYSKGTLTLTVGNGSVIMKNVDTSTDFNINDTSYKISGSKLVKK